MLYKSNNRPMDHTPLQPLDPRLAAQGRTASEPWYVSLTLWLAVLAVPVVLWVVLP